jgi:hypothetical protein
MSSVQGEDRCDRCGGVRSWVYESRSGDWWVMCHRCGFEESENLISDEDGYPDVDEEGYYRYEHVVQQGRGAYFLHPREGGICPFGGLAEDFRPELLAEAFDIDEIERVFDPSRSYIAYYDEQNGTVSVLWGDAEPALCEQEPPEPDGASADERVDDACWLTDDDKTELDTAAERLGAEIRRQRLVGAAARKEKRKQLAENEE